MFYDGEKEYYYDKDDEGIILTSKGIGKYIDNIYKYDI
jgi:hypothetical protein